MGMWTRDEEYGRRLDEEYPLRRPFILVALSTDPDPLVLESGEVVERAILETRPCDADGRPNGPSVECKTTATAIVKMVDEVEEGDLPAVVELRKVPSRDYDREALVMRLVRRLR